jgi:DNA-binding CsgD family transcriptional regulator
MLKKSRFFGFLFAGIFMAGYILNIFVYPVSKYGFVGTFLDYNQIINLLWVTLFVLSALVQSLQWIQPAIFLISSPLTIIQDAANLYGLGFFIMGILLLERSGFFYRHRLLKAAIVVLYLLAIEIIAAAVSKRPLVDAAAPTFFIVSFGLFLWFLYKDRLVVILKEPKQAISLSGKGLSPAECSYVMEAVRGKSPKEIAAEFELSESTIRNTLFRAYKKLGIEDKAGLAVFAERYEILE